MKFLTRLLALLVAAAVLPLSPALGQGGVPGAPAQPGPMWAPNWYKGYVPTPYEWQLMWSNKLSYFASGLPVTYGGTGANNATQALVNLGGMPNTLGNGKIFVGSSSNVASPVTPSGGLTMNNAGVFTLTQFDSLTPGAVPASGGGSSKFIRSDSSWVDPGSMNISWTQPQYFSGGNAAGSEANSGGSLVSSFFPTGDNRAVVSTKFASQASPNQLGFFGGSFYYNGKQGLFINEGGWSFAEMSYAGGMTVNAIDSYPGTLGSGGSFRWQNYGISGDFRTDAGLFETVVSSTDYLFTADITLNSNTLTNLVYDPTADTMLTAAVAYGAVNVHLHSNGAVGIPATAKISTFNAATITLDQNATANLTGQHFSLVTTAPQANFGATPFQSYIYRPFVGDITSGSKVITNLKFDPTVIGLPPSTTIQAPVNLPPILPVQNANRGPFTRVVNFTDTTLTVGDPTTGQPFSPGACTAGTGVTFTINTGNLTYTTTADIDANCNITNVAVDPLSIGLPTDGTAAWGSTKLVNQATTFSNVNTITGVTSTTIVMSDVSEATVTGALAKIQMARVNVEARAMGYGSNVGFLQWGYDTTIGKPVTKFETFPVYYNKTQVIDTNGNYTGPIPSLANGETLSYAPVEYAANNTLLHSADLSSTDWTTLGTNIASVVASSRAAPNGTGTYSEYLVTSSGTNGSLAQRPTITADTLTRIMSCYFDTTSLSSIYAIGFTYAGGGNSGQVQYNTANNVVSGSGLGYGMIRGPQLADGSYRYRLWTAAANTNQTTLTATVYVNGINGAASSALISQCQVEKLTNAYQPLGPSSWIPTVSVGVTRPAGVSPYLLTSLTAGSNTYSGNNTFSGTNSFTGVATLQQPTNVYTAPTISSNTLTLDRSLGSVYNVSLNDNITTLTVSNTPAGLYSWFLLNFTADGTPRTIAFPANWHWGAVGAPTPTSTNGKRDEYMCQTTDGGTTYDCAVYAQAL